MRAARTLVSRGSSLPVLVLAVLLVDSLGEELVFHPEWGFDSYEITIPKKLSFRGGEQGVAKYVSYLLHVKGKNHILHLWPKRLLLPRNLQVFSFTEQGRLSEDHPYIPSNCNYMGLVEGNQDSEATLSTCLGGLRGILQIEANHYQIEPLKASSKFEHVIYLLKKEEAFPSRICGLTDDATGQQMAEHENRARMPDFSESYIHQTYLELALVFDNSRYLYLNSNLTLVINDAILLAAIADSYFQDVRMRIHLLALEVWTDRDKIALNAPVISQVLSQFVQYRTSDLSRRIPADWAHLYIKKHFRDALAQHWGTACSTLPSGSTSSLLDKNILGPATWAAHSLGHSVGMSHDYKYCQCKGRQSCIMGTGRTGFSNCSYAEFYSHVSSGLKCLTNTPGLGYVVKRCGNKIVEDNEECDCGSREDCKEDQCCQPDCKFKEGANCSTGLCCHNCHFRPSGYMCRREENECDLAEYCSGTSAFCPNDTYKQDGTACKYKARCVRKGCRSRTMQCQNIFGADAMGAPLQCYDAVNVIGDQYGNCGILGLRQYEQCARERAICGRLQCINVETIPDMPDHTILIATHLREENLMCWGIGYHLAMVPMGLPDLGVIHDGTSCGKERICFNRNCVNSSVLNFDCFSQKCNRRGVCNNNKNCHCMYGWAPPFCEEMGYGGSIDSGSPGPLKEEVPASLQVVSLMSMRLIFLIISMIVVFFRKLIERL
ncbi:disintegrin and metalloproteinase domain-containing protein 30-like [Hippopotamus amphibius kiboko]|uniref:disintegrin and metalloproteinase domain-containing protein 30-like n=1 Tax=Hippopotamus amphibius kiboko TaxID=575201 RepID=UPI0025934CB3|nr:disintegrin and metalloproteinase domain-containing protein 30-like [Hippopotamus amphibius kiboko]